MEDWELRPARDLGLSHAERMRSLRREAGLVEWTIGRCSWWIVRTYLRLRHRLQVEGREQLPAEPPFVLVANHSSHLDALSLAAVLPGHLRACAFPVAAGDTFFKTAASASFAALILNALPMWRRNCGSHALDELRRRLVEEPCIYILFPEGTRARDGQLGTFKAGIGMIVADTDVPVVPCHIEGAFEAWPPDAKRPRGGRLRIRIGPPLRFGECTNRGKGWREVASQLRAAVDALVPKDAAGNLAPCEADARPSP